MDEALREQLREDWQSDAEDSYRDYVAEMRAIIDAETAETPYVSAQVAKRIVLKLRDIDPGLLYGWLDLQADNVVRSAINTRDASKRAHARATANSVAFGKAAKRFAEGDSEALGTFLTTVHVVAVDGTRKRIGEMTNKDLAYAAATYTSRAKFNTMQAAFLAALANSLRGNQKVGDKYDNETLSKLWLSTVDPSIDAPTLRKPPKPKVIKAADGTRTVGRRTR